MYTLINEHLAKANEPTADPRARFRHLAPIAPRPRIRWRPPGRR
ncbi:MAG: hypothetical protein JWO74_3887 [Solirubrobacterales bacterium]|nr:hypothetical protein [Solirubrobacterales bacterium]